MEPFAIDQVRLNFNPQGLMVINAAIGLMMLGMALDLDVDFGASELRGYAMLTMRRVNPEAGEVVLDDAAAQAAAVAPAVVVGVFVAAAVLTPPDPVSQIALAVPTLLLYEISIFCVRMVEKKRTAAEAPSTAPSS